MKSYFFVHFSSLVGTCNLDQAKVLLKESIVKSRETFHDVSANIKMIGLFATLYENVHRWEDAKSLLSQSWELQKKLLVMASDKVINPISLCTHCLCFHHHDC